MNRRRLYRCVHDQKIAGVCAGLAEYFDIDPTWVRVVFLLGLFMGGIGFLLYIVMAIIVPLEPETFPAPGPWQPGSERWGATGAAGWGAQRWGVPASGAPAPGASPEAGAEAGEAANQDASAADAADAGATGATTQSYDPSYPGAPGAYPGAAPADWQAQNWHSTYASHRGERSGRAGQFFGAVLILFGAVMLADTWLPGWSFSHNLWPLFILGVGALLVFGSMGRRSKEQ